MRCEIVAIGTELLLGQIVDTNSSWMGEQLALAGIDSHYQTKVGDNLQRMIETIALALQRSEAVIVCGGLGPTQDDITREAIAAVMGVRLVRRDDIGARIRAMFESRGRRMSENNLNQADVPEGAEVIPQMPGTAPGLMCPVGHKVIYAVPGVPHEMRTMVGETVIPDLQRRAGQRAVIRSLVMKTWGFTESGLAELLADRIRVLDDIGNPTLAFQAGGIEGIKVRVTAKAATEAEADKILTDERQVLQALIGDAVFGYDDDTMESVVLSALRTNGQTLAVAEAVSGGLLAARLSAVRELNRQFHGALVLNDTVAAARLFPRALRDGGILDPGDFVTQVADDVRQNLRTQVGVAAFEPRHLQALASAENVPALQDLQPGTVFFGLSVEGRLFGDSIRLPGDRRRIQQYSVISLLNFLRKRL